MSLSGFDAQRSFRDGTLCSATESKGGHPVAVESTMHALASIADGGAQAAPSA
jgi:hypothetical protein